MSCSFEKDLFLKKYISKIRKREENLLQAGLFAGIYKKALLIYNVCILINV